MMDEITLWWENMAGPRMLIEEMAKNLLDGKSIVLRLNGDLPWQSSMRDFLAHQLSYIQIRQATLRKCEKQEILPQLMQQLSRPNVGYCPQDYKSQIRYAKDQHIFRECVIWLEPELNCDLFSIMQFLSDFRGEGLSESGCFVLEIPMGQSIPNLSKSVLFLNGTEAIRSDDIHLFSGILADSIREIPEYFRGYAARLASTMVGRSGELVLPVLRALKADESPDVTWAALEAEYMDMVPHRSQTELEQLVWHAQLQTVFADIELERLKITAQWKDAITAALQTKAWDSKKNEAYLVRQFGEEIECAANVELGTLVHMMSLRRSDDHSQWLIYIPDEESRNWIRFLCACRNKLAHHKNCLPEEMNRLLLEISRRKN